MDGGSVLAMTATLAAFDLAWLGSHDSAFGNVRVAKIATNSNSYRIITKKAPSTRHC